VGRADGIHFGTGQDYESGIWDLLSGDAPTVMNEPEAQWHWYKAKYDRPAALTIWRASPAKSPASRNWDASTFSRDVFVNIDNHYHRSSGIWPADILLLNELNLDYERGDSKNDGGAFDTNPANWPGLYARLATFLDDLLVACRNQAESRGFLPRFWFPGWAPGHGEYRDDIAKIWTPVADRFDGVCLHSYTNVETITNDVVWYLERFPNKSVGLFEWNTINYPGSMSDHIQEEARIRSRLKIIGDAAPRFYATYFIYAWAEDRSHQHDIDGNDRRKAIWDGRTTLPGDDWKPPQSILDVSTGNTPDQPPEPPTEPPAMTIDPWRYWTAEQIAAATNCPLANVTANWPRIVEQLDHCNLADNRNVYAAILGIVAHETASTFTPLHEYGSPADWAGYSGGPNYAGRGFVQLTHDFNYRAYGEKVRALWGAGADDPTFDLVANPDNVMDPDIAAAIIALWWRDTRALPTASYPAGYSLVQASEDQDWAWVSRLVQGSTADQPRVELVASALEVTPAPPPVVVPTTLTYDPNTPPERQIQSWVCSIRSTRWMLKSLGVQVDVGALQDYMTPRYVTPDDGLLDASGAGIKATLEHYLPAGTNVVLVPSPTWDDIIQRAGHGPIAIGSSDPQLYHWLNVASVQDGNSVIAPNPAPGWPSFMPLGDVLTRAEFETFHGWSMVYVPIDVAPPSFVPPTSDPLADMQAQRDKMITALSVAGDEYMDSLRSQTDALVDKFADLRQLCDQFDALIAGIRDIRAAVVKLRTDNVGPRPQ
jgi:hypothetical protein